MQLPAKGCTVVSTTTSTSDYAKGHSYCIVYGTLLATVSMQTNTHTCTHDPPSILIPYYAACVKLKSLKKEAYTWDGEGQLG